MTVTELVARFPEVPADLHGEAALREFAVAFGDLLQVARKPSNCATQHDAANHLYLRLVGPFATYGYGLMKRDRLLRTLEELTARRRSDPDAFPAALLPPDVAPEEIRGPGCR
jgi:hypothetical protein